MASIGALEDLLDELLSSDDEEQVAAQPQPAASATSPAPRLVPDLPGKAGDAAEAPASNGHAAPAAAAAPAASFPEAAAQQLSDSRLGRSAPPQAGGERPDDDQAAAGTSLETLSSSLRQPEQAVSSRPASPSSGQPAECSPSPAAELRTEAAEGALSSKASGNLLDSLSASSAEEAADLLPGLSRLDSDGASAPAPPEPDAAEPAGPSEQLPAHVVALAAAEALERDLATGRGVPGLEGAAAQPGDPTDRLRLLLRQAQQTAPPQPGLGRQLLVRAEVVAAMEQALAGSAALGEPRAVALHGNLLAVGTSAGVCLVLAPRPAAPDSQARGAVEVVSLGQPRAQQGAAVTCLAFSPTGGLLLAGRAGGDCDFWELRRGGWELGKSVRDAHAAAVLQAAFLEGQSVGAVTADARGRLVHHPVSAYLSLAALLAGRLSKAAQPAVLTDGRQLGPVACLAPLVGGKAAEGQHLLESMLAICSARGCFVGRVGADGRLGLLHNIPRPPGAREGCLPYAAWRLQPPDAAARQSRFAHALLVTAWERQLYLLEVPIPVLPPSGEGPPAEKPPVRMLRTWRSEQPVTGVFWLEGPAIAAVSQAGRQASLALYTAAGEERDSLALTEPLLGHSDLLGGGDAPETCFHTSAAASATAVVLLGSQGVRLARLLGWRERLACLQEAGQLRRALSVALEMLLTARGGSEAAAAWRGEGRGADAAQVQEALAGLLAAFLDSELPSSSSSSSSGGGSSPEAAEAAAAVAIELCLALDRRSLLWSAVFPRFQAAGLQAPLLALLLPHVFSDELTALAPEVMQALVEHFASAGQPRVVEAAVMHMAVASLDLNQVVRLCRQHSLHSALAFLFPRALLDHVTPAAELAAALALASGAGERRRLALKLLVFLRLCFRGDAFPPGSGRINPGRCEAVREQLLGLLLHGSPGFLASLLEGDSGRQASLAAALPGPHPVLRCLAAADTGATLLVLREALAGCGLTDAALRAAAGAEPAPGSEDCLAEQAVLDAVVALEACGALEPQEGAVHALEFVAETVAEGRVTAAAPVILRLLRWLAAGPWRDGQPPPAAQREAQFAALLQHLDVRPGGSAAEPHVAAAREARGLARQAGFLRAEARVQQLLGDTGAALRCLLAVSPAAAFEFLEAGPQPPAHAWQAAADLLPELVRAEPTRAAGLVLRCSPAQQQAALASLASQPELQFRFLQGVMRACQAAPPAAAAADAGPLAAALLPGQPPAGALAQQAQTAELFVSLLCRFAPGEVLPFLQANEAYRVQEVLPFCQAHGCAAAEAFLLERLGDVTAALDILVAQLDAALQRLAAAAAAGRIPAAELSRLGRTHSSPHTRLLGPARGRGLPGAQQQQQAAPEVPAAAARLRDAAALCQRASHDAGEAAAQELWLRVLRCCAGRLRQLRSDSSAGGSGAEAPEAAAGPALQRLLMGCMEEVIADWAGAAPLAAIADRLLHEFAADCFGDFRGSLVGLLAAYSYERSILQAANRLMSADAFRVLSGVYRARLRAPTELLEVAAASSREQASGSEAAPEAGSSSGRPGPSQRSPPAQPAPAAGKERPRSSRQGAPAIGGLAPGQPPPPPHRSGCDINWLRAHGLRSMAD